MIRFHDVVPIQPDGAVLPAERVRAFLDTYPLPTEVGRGWASLDPDYAKDLLALLYAASAETRVLTRLFVGDIIGAIPGRGLAVDIGSGPGRLVEIFRGFERVTLVERDERSLPLLRERVAQLALPASILETNYDELDLSGEPCDLKTFTHSIYYFECDWNELARTAFSTIRPGGSLVFTLNGDEGGAARMVDDLAAMGYRGLSKLDIASFIAACTRIPDARVSVHRLPLRIHDQQEPAFMVHMARIFLEDLRVPIATEDVLDYLRTQADRLNFVDKVIELKRE